MNAPDPIARLNAALEGRYRIESELGEGGMANVYLADDLKHERKVALKVLKPELAAVVGAERFLAEIKTTANLQHPHILPLFDSGEADGFLFFVMPYVEGETLRDRIDRERQLPVAEAVQITVAIAGALQHAHERGVIHRDIKPANILMQDGQPFVADFGIALAVGGATGARLTETGLSVGTPFYMSPEQATGDQPAGPASDIYALTAVLYEMLTGDPPYTGSTAQAVLGKIIQGVPVSATSVRQSVPAAVDGAIRMGLEKLPADRFATADAFAHALTDESFRYGGDRATDQRSRRTSGLAGVGIAVAAAAVGVIVGGAFSPAGEVEAPRVIASELTFGPGGEGYSLQRAKVSDDGSVIVYMAFDRSGTPSLFVRNADDVVTRPVPDTKDAWQFALSPTGDEVVFVGVALGPLRVASTRGGGVRTLASEAQGEPIWHDRHIYFVNADFGISRTLSTGGDVQEVSPRSETAAFRVPDDILPGDETLLFSEVPADGSPSRIGALALTTGEVTWIGEGARARYVDGVLVYSHGRDGQIMGALFDPRTFDRSSQSVALVSGLGLATQFVRAVEYTVSETGDLIYPGRGSSGGFSAVPVWVDRSGAAVRVDADWRVFPVSAVTGLDLSHDGTRVAVASVGGPAEIDIWVKDLSGGPAQQVTFDAPLSTRPFWGPDDADVYFFRDDQGGYAQGDLLAVSSDGSGAPRVVMENTGIGSGSWRPGHDWMIYRVGVPAHPSRDVFAVRPEGGEAREIVATDATEQAPSLSPDGRWLLYQSDRSGEHNVFIRPFPNVDEGLIQVSLNGGTEPQWSPAGDELFYRDPDGQMTAASVESSDGLQITGRQVLFDASRYWADPAVPQYDVDSNGQRFLMLESEASTASMMVVWNWIDGVKERLGQEEQ